MRFNLADLFEAVADTVPDQLALVSGTRRLTYAELDRRADLLAEVLLGAGVGRDDFVGIQLPNGSEYLEAMLAAFKIRAVPVNINYRYLGAELRHLYADAGLVALIHHTDFDDAVAEARGRSATTDSCCGWATMATTRMPWPAPGPLRPTRAFRG